jgi:hypothetical protein
MAQAARGGSSSAPELAAPESVVVASVQATQATTQASQQMVQVFTAQAQEQIQSNKNLVNEIRALRRDILTGFKDTAQTLIGV